MVDLSKQSVHPPLLPAVVFTDAHFGVITQLVTEEYLCYVTGRGGTSGGKFRISLALPVGAVINCADNTGIVVDRGHMKISRRNIGVDRHYVWGVLHPLLPFPSPFCFPLPFLPLSLEVGPPLPCPAFPSPSLPPFPSLPLEVGPLKSS